MQRLGLAKDVQKPVSTVAGDMKKAVAAEQGDGKI